MVPKKSNLKNINSYSILSVLSRSATLCGSVNHSIHTEVTWRPQLCNIQSFLFILRLWSFLGMAAMPFPLWSSYNTVNDSLASFTFTKISLGFYIWKSVY